MSTDIFNSREYLVAMDLPGLADRIAKQTGNTELKQEMEFFRDQPFSRGLSLSLGPDASIFIFVPNLLFGDKFKLGSHIWVYFTETQECVCLQ